VIVVSGRNRNPISGNNRLRYAWSKYCPSNSQSKKRAILGNAIARHPRKHGTPLV
jgi:hypothetical protein